MTVRSSHVNERSLRAPAPVAEGRLKKFVHQR